MPWCKPDIAPSMAAYLFLPVLDAEQRMLAQACCACRPRIPAHCDWHNEHPLQCAVVQPVDKPLVTSCTYLTTAHILPLCTIGPGIACRHIWRCPPCLGTRILLQSRCVCSAMLHMQPHLAPVTGLSVSQVACWPADMQNPIQSSQ